MSIVWHIFKKDARLMLGPLAAWVGLQLTTFAIVLMIDHPAGVYESWGWSRALGMAHILFLVVGWGTAYLFAALPIHEDAVSGQDTFWTTRPISRAQLLGAKVLSLVLFFLVLPVLLRLPWWLGHGFGWRETLLAARDTGILSGVLTLMAFALASLTDNAGQFYRWTMGTIGAAGAALLLGKLFSRQAAGTYLLSLEGLWSASLALPLAVALTVIAIYQFLSPNRLRTVFFLVTVPMLIALGLARWTVFSEPKVAESWNLGVKNQLLTIERKSGLPGTFVTFQHAYLHAKAHPRLSTSQLGRWVSIVERSESDVWQKALDFPTSASRPTQASVLISPRDGSLGIASEGLEATVRVEGSVWEVEYVMELPLKSDSASRQGGRSIRIDSFSPVRSDGVTREERRGRLVVHETFPVLSDDAKSRPEGQSEFYLLVTKSGRKRIAPDAMDTLSSSGVGIRTSVFPLRANEVGPSIEEVAGELQEARLVKVGLRRLGAFSETIPIPASLLPPSTP